MVKGTGQGVEAVAIGLDVKLDGANEKLEQELSKTTKKLSAVFANATGAGFATAGAAVVGVVAALGAAMALTVGASTKFEDSFAGIKKTVNASDAEFKQLALSVRELATEIPIATSQLNQIGELGGQLGVKTSGLPIFIDTIAKLGVATRLSTETAALSLARLQTIFQLPENEVSNLASSLVDLGNNFAALEDEILSTSLRLAAGAKVAGATVADTLAIATALQAVGVQSQAGGTAMARVFQAITIALQGGVKEMQVFAQVTGLGVEGFRKLATENPAEALNVFLVGLSKASDEGRNLVEILDQLGLKQQRTIRALLAVSEAGDLLTDTLATANTAFDLNIALQEEANKRFETAKSQTKLFKNAVTELRIEIGNFFLPALKNILAGLTGTALAMGDNDKAAEGMSNALKAFIVVVGSLSAAIMFTVGNLALFKVMALGTGQTVGQVIKAFASLDIVTKGYSTTAILAAKATTILSAAIFPIVAALSAITIGFIIYQGAQTKATRAVEAYTKAEATRLALVSKSEENQRKLADAIQAATEAGEDPDTSPAVIAARRTGEILDENLVKMEKISNMTFLNIPTFRSDFELDEADDIVGSFDAIISKTNELDSALAAQSEGALFPEVAPLAEQFAEEFGISVEKAQKIIGGGFTSIREFLTLESMADPKVFAQADKLFSGYFQNISAASRQSTLGLSQMDADQEAIVRMMNGNVKAAEVITERIGRTGTAEEQLLEARLDMLERYNTLARETEGMEEIEEDIFLNFPEEARKVFDALFNSQDRVKEKTDEIVISTQDLENAFSGAMTAAVDFRQVIEDIDAPKIIDFQELEDGVQMVKDLNVLLASGVIKILEAGFPALALDIAKGGLAAENLGQMIAIVESGIDDTSGTITAMNESIIAQDSEIAQQVENYHLNKDGVLDVLKQEHGITRDIGDLESNRASIQRVFNTMQKESTGEQANYLALVKEVLSAERSIIDAKEEIKDLEDEITSMTEDLVFDNIVITNEMRDQVTIAEALQNVNEAIAEFGEEGVITNKEKLTVLQAELNIQRMTDKLENKRSKRQEKSIRDKKKEVEFLKKAVEQGVVEQLDLDAAQEELDDMLSPMSQKEKDILTLQKEIAEAELEVIKARQKSVDPSIISAIENYNSALKVTADRDEKIIELTTELERKTQDLQIEQAEVAERYDEILEKYPDFKEKSMEIAQMIGIPQQVMKSTLDSMKVTVDEFINYVDFAKSYRDSVTGHGGDPSDFDPQRRFVPIDDKYESDREEDKKAREMAQAGTLHTYRPPSIPNVGEETKGFFENLYDNFIQGFSPSAFIPFYKGRAYGGTVPMGRASVVGEMGPETIMSTPGGTSVFANKTGAGGSGVNIQNMNLNITGLPADPITARKVAQNIQRELNKLEKEGRAGTGLVNR